MDYKLIATTTFGLEGITAKELKEQQKQNEMRSDYKKNKKVDYLTFPSV